MLLSGIAIPNGPEIDTNFGLKIAYLPKISLDETVSFQRIQEPGTHNSCINNVVVQKLSPREWTVCKCVGPGFNLPPEPSAYRKYEY